MIEGYPKMSMFVGSMNAKFAENMSANLTYAICNLSQIKRTKQTLKRKKSKQPNFRYLFFDFESMTVDTKFVDSYDKEFSYEKAHKINCAVAQKSCSFCKDKDVSEDCEICVEKEVVFMGDDCGEQFCKCIFSGANEHYTCFAHNFRSYDGYFIIKYAQEQKFHMEHIENGGKIMVLDLSHHKLKFIDSLNFIPMPLKKFRKSFGVNELKKGYFSHLFNTIGNQDYVGSMPDKSYFDPDGMSTSERTDFLKWYEQNKNRENYNLRDEMEAYCRSDVDILHQCVLHFRDLFLESTNVDPFESCITIASACNLVFRQNFLKEEAIGIIPNGGYRCNQVQSVEAQKWMKYLEITRKIKIKRSSFGGEERIGKYKIDGTYTNEHGEKILLEYVGCFWHGHSKCFKRDVENPQVHETMGTLEGQFFKKINYLKSEGYKVEVMWGCDFKMIQESADYKQHEKEIQETIVPPLVARDALFGGRTNACKLYAKVENPGDQIL